MKNTILLFLLLTTISGFAQNDGAFVDLLVAQKMAELELQGNQDYFYKKDYCEGNIQMFTMPDGSLCKPASNYYAVYVFWKESKEIIRMQKFDNCGSFIPLPLSLKRATTKLLSDKKSLQSGNIKSYEADKIGNGNMDTSLKDCYTAYKFVFGSVSFEKKFSHLDVSTDLKHVSKHAEANNALPLMELDMDLTEMVKNIDKNGKFVREK